MNVLRPIKNRSQAGKLLADLLGNYAHHPEALVLGLPRGGVVVAFEVARALRLPLDVFLVGKLGAPMHNEFAIGAVAVGGKKIVHTDVVKRLGMTDAQLEEIARRKLTELRQKEQRYRVGHVPLKIEGHVVILVDDGLATGLTVSVAIDALRLLKPRRIVVAIPVASKASMEEISVKADEVVCLSVPKNFQAVSQWYDDFSQVDDQTVVELLDKSIEEESNVIEK